MTATPPQQPQATTPIPFQLMINSQYVKDFSFENPNAPKSFMVQGQPKVSVNVQVQALPLAEQTFEVVLMLRAEGRINESPAFIVELSYGAVCTVQQGTPAEVIRPLLMIEVPRQMFPFARAIVADAVRDGGFGPLLLNPVDFTEMYRRQILSEQQQQQKTEAAPVPMPKGAVGNA